MPKKKKSHKEKFHKTLKEFHMEIRKQMATFITGAFSFVAALVWRDAIRSFIDSFITTEGLKGYIHAEWMLNVITAVIITFVAVLGIIITSKIIAPKD